MTAGAQEWLAAVGVQFGWPAVLPALAGVPLLWLLEAWTTRRRERRLATVVGPRAGVLAAEAVAGRRRLRRLLGSAAFAAALVALAQPSVVDRAAAAGAGDAGRIDLLVCLDVSRSMLARDVVPTRLEAAKREIGALAAELRGDRLGLVAFAGEARLTVPVTRDVATFEELLAVVDAQSVRRGGTDLAAALRTAGSALEALGPGRAANAVVLLITDGEDLEARGRRAAAAVAEAGIVVHCVGYGSARGSKIAVAIDGGGTPGAEEFVRDASGAEVVTALDPASLTAIAGATGGRYVAATDRAEPLRALYREAVLPMARTAARSVAGEAAAVRAAVFQWPLGVAVLLWLGRLAVSERRRAP